MLPSLTRFTAAPAAPIAPRRAAADPIQRLKQGIWAYFLLLLFEGALRKWVLPGLSTPLLIIRDPLALWLVLAAWRQGLLPANGYLGSMTAVGIIAFFTALLFGHGSIPVAVYGARILLLHFPLIFVIGRVFDRSDVERIGRAMLWIAIPMTVLIGLQFYSPQSAWVNRGVGGDMEGAGFSGALGFFRPPGTFSFATGNTEFYSLLACFVFYFWLQGGRANRLVLAAATVGLLAAIPFSIARSLLFQTIISLLFALLAASRQPKYLARIVPALVAGAFLLVPFSQTSLLKTPLEAFTTRIELASDYEGGVVKGTFGDRYLGGMVRALTGTGSTREPFFGYGIGMGTNVGSNLLSGRSEFLIAEDEWGRLIGEMGMVLGLTAIFIRLGLGLKIAWASYRQLARGQFLPWMLVSFGIFALTQGQWAQPTALGFSIMVSGLMLAALRQPRPEPIAAPRLQSA
ncbi:hypothetical protein ACFQ48_05430 [Hymenobacter caeli]|uniref:O-antigen ligase domain-containing protein n=1 Tax=Hymenobacter caeli TaxID=2735894 RepID=A0ABX2FQ56_9BACT|nr:hypothetical protein [Hymenobacter caeli]NRT18681.1 hypothetical protein [Hymenobacter caeli]